jgi:hypothetical protein
MKGIISVVVLAALASASEDVFNYDSTSGTSFGPEDWDKVSCDNLATCVSWMAAHSLVGLYPVTYLTVACLFSLNK